MWNCKKCNEENEDSFDSCWNCQTFSNEGSQKSSETQRKIVKEEKNKKDEDDFEESIELGLKKYKPTIITIKILLYILAILLGSLCAGFLIGLTGFDPKGYGAIPNLLFYSVSYFLFIYTVRIIIRKIQLKYRKKVIQELQP